MLKSAEQIVKTGGLPGKAWNVFSGGMAGASAMGAVDTALDGRDQREGDPSAMMQASDSAGWLTTTPALMNRFGAPGGYRRGAIGALSLPSTLSGTYQGLTSGNLVDTGLGALDATMAYQGGKEVYNTAKQAIKSPGAQKAVSFLNNQAVPAARAGFNAAKPIVTEMAPAVAKSALKQAPATIGKFVGKKIPLLGLGIGLGLAGQRAQAGDYLGAAGEAVSGALSTVPVLGTAASTAIDAGLIARDNGYLGQGVNPAQQKGSMSAGGTLSGPALPDVKTKMETLPNSGGSTNPTSQPAAPNSSSNSSKPIVKLSEFRRNTGIEENGEVWVNPKDREQVEKLSFCWEDYIKLPPAQTPETPAEYFKDLV